MPLPQTDLRPFIERLLLKDFVSPCVIVNTKGDILYFHNRTGKYLEPATGEANLNILHMARHGLQMTLSSAFHKAVNDQQDKRYENLEVRTNGDVQIINLIIHNIQEPDALKGLILIMFEDVHNPPVYDSALLELDADDVHVQQISKLERDLQTTQEFLQTTREELETSNEELKSTNEELQSANEELQSANEELETSKEEVNSVNEELLSANSELQSKIEGFSRANNDLQNLLNSIEFGIIFLDTQLNIQRFNPAVNRLFNVIESDIGRSITHITSNFKQENLLDNIQAVLDTLTSSSIEISTNNDDWYVMKIRPYRTVDNIIDGVVITFNNISDQKQMQAKLSQQQAYANSIINTIRHPFLVLNHNFAVISSNTAFYTLFGVSKEQTVGESLFELGTGQWDIPQLRELLERIIEENAIIEDFTVQHDFPIVGHKKVILTARSLEYEISFMPLILLAIEDISEQAE